MSQSTVQPPTVPTRPWLPMAIIGILVLVVAGFGLYNFTRPQPATVTRRDIIGYVPLNGQVLTPPGAYAEAHAAYAAPIEKVDTTLGANVKRGDILVELASPSANEDYTLARQNVKAAETAYANARITYDAEVRNAQKQLAAARSAGNGSSANTTTGTDTSSANSGSDSTSGSTTSSMDVDSAEQALQQARSDREQGLAVYQQQLDATRAVYQDARAGKKMTLVRAPISGTVTTLNAQPGQQVGQDTPPVAVIVNLNALQVRAPLTPNQAGVVKPKMPVTLAFDSVPNKQFEGKVLRIVTQADPDSAQGVIKGATYVALIAFDNKDGEIKPQAMAQVAVKAGEAKNAIAVPAEAIAQDSTGKPVVHVLQDGKWQEVAVQTGLTDGRYTQVKSGLKEGATVQVTRTLLATAFHPGTTH